MTKKLFTKGDIMDYSDCMPSTISWALSALAYDENRMVDHVQKLFPSFKTHCWSHDNGSHFHGVTIDPRIRIWHWHRGTDGYDTLGKLESWFNNFCVGTGKDGTHNGMDRLAHHAFDDAKYYLEKYDYIYECGHSQGGGVAPLDACLCVENLTPKHVHADLFSAPPCVTPTGAKRINMYIHNGMLSCNRYVMPGDPIASQALRMQRLPLLNGEDVGEEVILPDLFVQRIGPGELLNHSCRVQNAAYMMLITKYSFEPPAKDLKLLSKIHDWIVN